MQIGRELQPLPAVACEQFRKILFMDERLAALKSRNFLLVIVNTDHVVSDLRKARCSNETDVTGTYNSNLHSNGPS